MYKAADFFKFREAVDSIHTRDQNLIKLIYACVQGQVPVAEDSRALELAKNAWTKSSKDR